MTVALLWLLVADLIALKLTLYALVWKWLQMHPCSVSSNGTALP